MSKQAKTDKMEILPPSGKLPNVANFQAVGNITSEDEMAAAILRDIDACERYGKFSLFLAVRIGLALTIVKDNGQHGDLGKFIEKHFSKIGRSSLNNYMRVAGLFLTDCKLRDSKFKLTNTAAIAPILDEQLELFTSPEAAKMEGVLKKLVNWAKKKELSDIYKALAKGEQNLPPRNFGNAGGRLHKLPTVKRRDDALEALEHMSAFMCSENWHALDEGDLARLDTTLGQFHGQVGALIQLRDRKGGRA